MLIELQALKNIMLLELEVLVLRDVVYIGVLELLVRVNLIGL